MKKILILLLCFCAVFLSIITFLSYSEQTYNSVFCDKTCLVIEKKDNQSDNAFILELNELSNKYSFNILYSTVINASSSKPAFYVYTTSISKEFIDINSNYKYENIQPDDTISTQALSLNDNNYQLFASNLYEDFIITDFCNIDVDNLEHSKFYVLSSESSAIESALVENGYGITKLMTNEFVEESHVLTELKSMFLILIVVVFFLGLCYAFSKRKEIVIKKAFGYREIDIFISTFADTIIAIPTVFSCFLLLSTLIIEAKYEKTFFDYLYSASKSYFIVIIILELVLSFSFLIVQLRKSVYEIRGKKPDKILHAISIVVKLFICAVLIMAITNIQSFFHYEKMLTKTYRSISNQMEGFVTVSLNETSKDIANNDEYFDNSKYFIDCISEKYKTVIVDSSGFVEDETEPVLYINSTYLDINPIFSTQGERLYIPNDIEKTTVLLPVNYNGTIPPDDEVEIIYYAIDSKFYTYNTFSAIETGGYIIDPVVVILNDEILNWNSEYIIGEQYILIQCDSNNPYEEIKNIIIESGMDGVILETPSVNELFSMQITNTRIKVSQYSIIGILYLFFLVLTVAFESVIYYENNKRLLCIKQLHGYGVHAYTSKMVVNLFLYAILIIYAVVLNLNVFLVFFALAIDVVVFSVSIRRITKRSITVYLKGDM